MTYCLKFILSFISIMVLVGCSSHNRPQPLAAPCVYADRSGCGPVIEMSKP